MKAASIKDAVIITQGPEFIDGNWWIYSRIDANDYDGFKAMPKAIIFEGRTYGLSAWNSDNGNVAYTTRIKVARKC